MSSDELSEMFKNKRTRIQSIRDELKMVKDLTDTEIIQIWNLSPETNDEALAWIPSLERLIPEGKEIYINQAVDVVRKYKNID